MVRSIFFSQSFERQTLATAPNFNDQRGFSLFFWNQNHEGHFCLIPPDSAWHTLIPSNTLYPIQLCFYWLNVIMWNIAINNVIMQVEIFLHTYLCFHKAVFSLRKAIYYLSRGAMLCKGMVRHENPLIKTIIWRMGTCIKFIFPFKISNNKVSNQQEHGDSLNVKT